MGGEKACSRAAADGLFVDHVCVIRFMQNNSHDGGMMMSSSSASSTSNLVTKRASTSHGSKKKRLVDFGAFVVRPNPPNTEFRRSARHPLSPRSRPRPTGRL